MLLKLQNFIVLQPKNYINNSPFFLQCFLVLGKHLYFHDAESLSGLLGMVASAIPNSIYYPGIDMLTNYKKEGKETPRPAVNRTGSLCSCSSSGLERKPDAEPKDSRAEVLVNLFVIGVCDRVF
jgi:hypothetical protein